MGNTDLDTLRSMSEKIEQIEIRALELQQLGQGIPVVEKNVRDILNTIYVLKFGISDLVELDFP